MKSIGGDIVTIMTAIIIVAIIWFLLTSKNVLSSIQSVGSTFSYLVGLINRGVGH